MTDETSPAAEQVALTDDEREALIDHFHFDCTDAGEGECDTTCHYLARHITEAVEHIIAARVAQALDDVDRRLSARIGDGRADPETANEGSYTAGFLDALESARHEVRWKRPDPRKSPVSERPDGAR